MSNQLEGVIHVTGEHDVGKTTFALECGADPAKILYFDDDVKGKATIADLQAAGIKFGRYVDLVALSRKKTEYDFHKEVIAIIQAIKPGEYDAIIWDTWTNFAASCHSYILKHPGEFRLNWAPMGTIKGAQQWQEARRYEAAIINAMAAMTKTLILVTHLKDHYVGKVKVPGKQVPASSPTLERIPRFRIWLRQNPNGRPVPIGLVLKRLDKKHFEAGKGIRTVSVLPRKIVPHENQHSLWDTIWQYWDEPFGDREPNASELPDDFELSILENTLSKDQKHTFKQLMDSGMLGDPEPEEIGNDGASSENVEKVHALWIEKKTAPLIAKETGLSMPVVLGIIKSLQEAELEEEQEEEPEKEEA